MKSSQLAELPPHRTRLGLQLPERAVILDHEIAELAHLRGIGLGIQKLRRAGRVEAPPGDQPLEDGCPRRLHQHDPIEQGGTAGLEEERDFDDDGLSALR